MSKLCDCGKHKVHSESLTLGMCLNCYQDWKDDEEQMNIDCAADFYFWSEY